MRDPFVAQHAALAMIAATANVARERLFSGVCQSMQFKALARGQPVRINI